MFSTSYTWEKKWKNGKNPKIEINLPLLFLPLFIGAIEVEPVPNQNVVFAVFFKVFSHLSSIDEVENLLHEVVEKDRLTEAKAKVPGILTL